MSNGACWYVSRQYYYYNQKNTVEIASGGLDYSGADMLTSGPAYTALGCDKTYTDPREAVAAATQVRRLWQKKINRKLKHASKRERRQAGVCIGMGSTMGSGIELEGERVAALKARADEIWEKLPKCDCCGELLPKEAYGNDYTPGEYPFCSEHCSEKDATFQLEQNVLLAVQEHAPQTQEGKWSCRLYDDEKSHWVTFKGVDGTKLSWGVSAEDFTVKSEAEIDAEAEAEAEVEVEAEEDAS